MTDTIDTTGMDRRTFIGRSAVAAGAAWAAPAVVGSLTNVAAAASGAPRGAWTGFSFGAAGSATPTFPIVVGPSGTFDVTDAFLSGDQFEVFVDGVSVGTTALPGTTGDQIGSDYDAAFADPRWSSGTFSASPGAHDLSFVIVLSPFGGGGAAFRV